MRQLTVLGVKGNVRGRQQRQLADQQSGPWALTSRALARGRSPGCRQSFGQWSIAATEGGEVYWLGGRGARPQRLMERQTNLVCGHGCLYL